jgi:hypothetical protein
MIAAVKIEPEAIFDDTALTLTFGVTPTAIAKARRNGTLRYTRKGRRVLYFGRWVIEWLGKAEEEQADTSAA